jgi:hypothetical protein
MRRTFLLIACLAVVPFLISCGGTTSAPAQAISVLVTPSTASVVVGQVKQFSDAVTGTTDTKVTWGVVGGAADGTISSGGLYVAPAKVPTPANVTITATSQADASKSGSATVTITSQSSSTVAVSPSAARVEVFTTQQFSATINGQPSSAVTWQVDGSTGGSTTNGTISASGLYSAPHSISNSLIPSNDAPVTVRITAVSTANTSNTGTATVTLTVPNQSTEIAPIELGTSGGSANDSITSGNKITCCSGTLGSLVAHSSTQYILSNDHVLARSGAGSPGDPIIQPGLIDTGTCTSQGATTVAHLTLQSFNLKNTSAATVDAAIAQVVSGAVDSLGKILLLGNAVDAEGVPVPGAPQAGGGVPASLSLLVTKSGRTTGLTCSKVAVTNATVAVSYTTNCDGSGTKFTVNYSNQVSVLGGDFSGPGDSGSLIVTQGNADPVALLYAGSDTDTVGNPVSSVLNFFAGAGNAVSFVGGNRGPGTSSQVIGCTLPGPQAAMAARLAVQKVTPSDDALIRATTVRDTHAAELMAHPEMQAVGVGASYDDPGEPAILFFVTRGQSRTNIPAQVDGVRTRIVEGDLFSKRGALSAADSASLEQSAPPPQSVYSVSDAEVARAKIVHAAHADEWMKKAGVQGVGIGSSVDSPGDAALVIFLVRGVSHDPIPPVIDGLRTRVRESSRFRAGFSDSRPQRGCAVPTARKHQAGAAPESPREP